MSAIEHVGLVGGHQLTSRMLGPPVIGGRVVDLFMGSVETMGGCSMPGPVRNEPESKRVHTEA
jgi:hypothetical protein